MSKSFALIAALTSSMLLAACGGGQQEEVVFVETPVVAEPVYNKY